MKSPLQIQLEKKAVNAAALRDAGIDDPRAQKLLEGADPTINEVRQVAAYFRIPVRSLISSPGDTTAGYKLRRNFREDLNVDSEVFDWLARGEVLAGVLPNHSEKRLSIDISFQEKNFSAAESLATLIRNDVLRRDAREPLINLESYVRERLNIRSLVVDQQHLEGGVVAHHDHFFIFLSTRPDPRMRFTFAHELCHYLCDVSQSGNSAWFDEDVLDPVGSDRRDEVFANAFASALLLPLAGVADSMRAIRDTTNISGDNISDLEIILLARFYGVSFQVAARRLEDLKLLPEGGGQSLYREINKKFGSPEKFADSLGLPSREVYEWSDINVQTLREALPARERGEISIGRLSEITNVPMPDANQADSA